MVVRLELWIFTSQDMNIMNMGSREKRGGLGRRRTQAVGMDGRRVGPKRDVRGLGMLGDLTRRRVTGQGVTDVGHRGRNRRRENERRGGEGRGNTQGKNNGAGRVRNEEGGGGGRREGEGGEEGGRGGGGGGRVGGGR